MPVNCESLLNVDITKDCDNMPVSGLEINILAFNTIDIDRVATTFDAATDLLCTNFQLLSGKTGYLIEGAKVSTNASSELVTKSFGNYYKQLIGFYLLNPTVENRKALEIICSGIKLTFIVEQKWKGQESKSAFLILGLDVGLEGSSSVWSSTEEDGAEKVEISSADGQEEPRKIYNLSEGDYPTTKAAFDNKFQQA